MVKRLTDDNFKKETSNGFSLVAFIAPWCPPCKRQAPVIDELDSEVGKLIKAGLIPMKILKLLKNFQSCRFRP